MTSIKMKKDIKREVTLDIPNGEEYLHKLYIECARIFWKNPYLFKDSIYDIDYQRNIRQRSNIKLR